MQSPVRFHTPRIYARAGHSPPLPPFLELPAELLIAILRLCFSADILRVCLTCRLLCDTGMPELYRTIDLSSHNADIDCEPQGLRHLKVPPDFIHRKWTRHDYLVFEKQQNFIKTLRAKPGLGKCVRELCWTITAVPHCEDMEWEDVELRREVLEKYSKVEHIKDEYGECSCASGELRRLMLAQEPVWQVFHGFVNVLKVDICWLIKQRPYALPRSLFPLVTSIRLSGCMTRELVECMLVQSAQQLRKLELHNLLQWSNVKPPLPAFTDLDHLLRYADIEEAPHEPIPGTRRMAGALNPFVGKCVALTSLCITTVGFVERWLTISPWDIRRYAEWAQFIRSVRSTLRFFTFKQGFDRNYYYTPRGSRPGLRNCPYTPIDKLFNSWILPALLEAPWPRIERMEFTGVGSPIELGCSKRAFPDESRETLRALLPDGAQLLIEGEPERDYEDPEEDNDGLLYG